MLKQIKINPQILEKVIHYLFVIAAIGGNTLHSTAQISVV